MQEDNCSYHLYKNFVDKKFLEDYIQGTERIISAFYRDEFIREHSAYFSDKSENRESYAFALWNGLNEPSLPCFPAQSVFAHSKEIARLSLRMHEILEVPRDSRLLLNTQIYKGHNKPVTPHFDGEYLDFESDPETHQLTVNEALRPHKVAVLVLHNESEKGGTTLHGPDGREQTVVGEPGDLLVFDNLNFTHSVCSLQGKSTRGDAKLRMTIGWRALDSKVAFIKGGEIQNENLNSKESLTIHKEFLKHKWPDIFKNLNAGVF